jgi:hypothetical protein
MTWLAVSLVVTLVCIDNVLKLHQIDYLKRVDYSYGGCVGLDERRSGLAVMAANLVPRHARFG